MTKPSRKPNIIDPFKLQQRRDYALIRALDESDHPLTDWEVSFIGNIIDQNSYPLTPSQRRVAFDITKRYSS